MRLSRFFLLFAALVSCGYREETGDYGNPLEGEWDVDEIRCFLDRDDSASEVYEMKTPVESVRFVFGAKDFSYSAQIDDNPGCNVSASGLKSVELSSASTGLLSLNNVGSHSTCTVALDEAYGLATDVQTPFGVNELTAQNLKWELGSVLIMEAPLEISGSAAGPCGENCECDFYLSKREKKTL